MKTLMNNTKFAVTILMVFFTMASVQSFGTGITDSAKDENPVELRYIGKTNNQPVFSLNLHNAEADQFTITLKSTSGDVIYSEKISGAEVERKYRINTDEIDTPGITIEVFSKKNNSKTVYAVNRQSHVVDDVIINKL